VNEKGNTELSAISRQPSAIRKIGRRSWWRPLKRTLSFDHVFPALTCGAIYVPPLRGWNAQSAEVFIFRGPRRLMCSACGTIYLPPLRGWCEDRLRIFVPRLRGWYADRV